MRRGDRGWIDLSGDGEPEALEANGNDRGGAGAEDEDKDEDRGRELERGAPRAITESDNKRELRPRT